ncbi:MAG: response regulator [Verrucomicrobiota bacterium]|nr:response regulator [Verrucomicrobiota bacterium]
MLYYDDDPTSLLILRTLLQQRGVQMLEAKTEIEAWAKLESHPEVDLVFLDHNLGDKQGWQWLAVLRNHPLFREVPVVVLTAQAERSDVIKYKGLGVADFLLKRPEIKKIESSLKQAEEYNWRKRIFANEGIFLRASELSSRLQVLNALIVSERYIEAGKLLAELARGAGKADAVILKSIAIEAQRVITLGISWEIVRIGNQLKLYANILQLYEKVVSPEYYNLELLTQATPAQPPKEASIVEKPMQIVHVQEEPYGLGTWAANDPLDFTQFKAFPSDLVARKITQTLAQPQWVTMARSLVRLFNTDDGSAQNILTENPALRLVLLEEAFSDPNLESEFQATFVGLTMKFGIERLQLVCIMPTLFANTPSRHFPWWAHGFAVGWLAADLRSIAGIHGQLNLPLAGLLHDAGKHLLSDAYPSTYKLLWTIGQSRQNWLVHAETALFGRNHSEIGRDWINDLGMPEIAIATAWHESPQECPHQPITQDLRYLRIADLLMRDVGRSHPKAPFGDELELACALCTRTDFPATSVSLPEFLQARANLTRNLTRELHIELNRAKRLNPRAAAESR